MHTPRSRLLVGAFFSLGLFLLWAGQDPAAGEPKGGEPKGGKPKTADVLPPVFSRPQPESIEDLKAIETRVQALLPKIIPAVVGIRIGPAQGSGVIIDKQGHVLTAGHVSGAPNADKSKKPNATVILAGGKTLPARSLGRNGGIDSGMMQIEEEGDYPHVEMGKSSALKKGDWVIAIGHPGGYRSNRTPVVRVGRVLLVTPQMIRTDCTLVGGDSGGPLFDMHGRVVGIHSRIGPVISENVHVPIDTYRATWDRLAKGEKFGGDSISAQPLVRSHGGKIVFEKNGRLAATDAKDTKQGGFAQTYNLKLKPGAIYTIDMISPPFKRGGGRLDPFLRLEDAQGKQLAEDDDGAGGLNSRIVFRPTKEEEYRIVATTFEPGQTGTYKIVVREAELKLLAGKIDVLRALGVHKQVALQIFDKYTEENSPLYATGQLFDATGKIVTGKSVEFRWATGERRVKADAHGEVRLQLGKQDVKNLYLDVPDGLKVALVLADAGGYPFVLDLGDEFNNPKVKSAGGKLVLEEKGELTGKEPLDKLRDDLIKENKAATFHKVYPFKLSAGSTYTIDLESTDFDAFLRLEDPAGKQVAFDDDGAGKLNSRIVYTPETDGVYRIVVTTCDPDQTGAYRLAVYQNDSKKEKASSDKDGLSGAADGHSK